MPNIISSFGSKFLLVSLTVLFLVIVRDKLYQTRERFSPTIIATNPPTYRRNQHLPMSSSSWSRWSCVTDRSAPLVTDQLLMEAFSTSCVKSRRLGFP
ncbi:unnamed protein product [Rhodiola kirilowii]